MIIIGGGLAGLVSASHLAQKGISVTLLEKDAYPKHKVCGEYISNEVLPYLQSRGFNPHNFGAKKINKLILSTRKSRATSVQLPLGGFGMSRYCIDAKLAELAHQSGAVVQQAAVTDIVFDGNQFTVTTDDKEKLYSDLVIGAFGKRSKLDIKLNRKFIKDSSPYLAVKAHYKGNFPEDTVGLHNFTGGYCGISKVENDHINICYLTDYSTFKKHKNIDVFQKEVVMQNAFLKEAFESYEMVFENPLTISQISFNSKNAVENHILMSGDSAGMIHPLAGNGMGMAIQSAQLVSSLLVKFYNGEIDSRNDLELAYANAWNDLFSKRLNTGHIIARIFRMGMLSEVLMSGMKLFPSLMQQIIKRTHGKPMD